MVESLLGSMLQSVVDTAQQANPLPPLSEEGEPISQRTILAQIQKNLESDPKGAMRLALVLASWIARQQGISEKDALMSAAVAWTQTTNLTPS